MSPIMTKLGSAYVYSLYCNLKMLNIFHFFRIIHRSTTDALYGISPKKIRPNAVATLMSALPIIFSSWCSCRFARKFNSTSSSCFQFFCSFLVNEIICIIHVFRGIHIFPFLSDRLE